MEDKYKLERAVVDTTPKEKTEFDIASQIKHPTFGIGKIVAKNKDIYTIVFEGIGLKKIDINYVKLEKM